MKIEITASLPNTLKKESLSKNNKVIDLLNEKFNNDIQLIQEGLESTQPIIESIEYTDSTIDTKFSINISNFKESTEDLMKLNLYAVDLIGDHINGFEIVQVHTD